MVECKIVALVTQVQFPPFLLIFYKNFIIIFIENERKDMMNMKRYQSKSWSQSAREMCTRQIQMIEAGCQTIDGATRFFSISYRHPRIRYRAAKRFGRLNKMNKIKENLELYNSRF